jgi:LacI family transcriptional regulator
MLLFHKLFDNKNPDSKFAYTDIVIKNRFNI